jgi:hypothetical protein
MLTIVRSLTPRMPARSTPWIVSSPACTAGRPEQPSAGRRPAARPHPNHDGSTSGRDAAFVVLSCADLADLTDLADLADLRAGLVEGRLQVAAFALGAGASGMTFFNSDIPELLGQPLAAGSGSVPA